VGQVRIDDSTHESVIGISVDHDFRGGGLSKQMLTLSTNHYLLTHKNKQITAYIKETNKASFRAFVSAGFTNSEMTVIEGNNSYKLIKR
jgi:RimJ/RimL family protein N-acetyltransferase